MVEMSSSSLPTAAATASDLVRLHVAVHQRNLATLCEILSKVAIPQHACEVLVIRVLEEASQKWPRGDDAADADYTSRLVEALHKATIV